MTDTAAVPPPRASLVHPGRIHTPATFTAAPVCRVRAADRFSRPLGDRLLGRARDSG